MIDLHMHTTASDGRCTPGQLVSEAAGVGLSVMAVTDHDTLASWDEVRDLAAARGIEAVTGVEITAVEEGRDVHVLGYFCDSGCAPLLSFLEHGRARRVERLYAIAGRLREHGIAIEVAGLERDAAGGQSVGRPQVARALVAAGHVADMRAAFDEWLAEGRPAFVPRTGPGVGPVVAIIHEAGGLASLAHPAITRIDHRFAELRGLGLDAIEVYHSSHDAGDVERYRQAADAHGFLATGGSDYHGDPEQGRPLGGVTLAEADWQRLLAARPHA